jgi:hypothetical protein
MDTKQVQNTKRKPPRAGMGRVKGTPNKATKEIKQMIEGALHALGGQKYLEQQAMENPVAFMGLVGKILPKDMTLTTDATLNIIMHKPGE